MVRRPLRVATAKKKPQGSPRERYALRLVRACGPTPAQSGVYYARNEVLAYGSAGGRKKRIKRVLNENFYAEDTKPGKPDGIPGPLPETPASCPEGPAHMSHAHRAP